MAALPQLLMLGAPLPLSSVFGIRHELCVCSAVGGCGTECERIRHLLLDKQEERETRNVCHEGLGIILSSLGLTAVAAACR